MAGPEAGGTQPKPKNAEDSRLPPEAGRGREGFFLGNCGGSMALWTPCFGTSILQDSGKKCLLFQASQVFRNLSQQPWEPKVDRGQETCPVHSRSKQS